MACDQCKNPLSTTADCVNYIVVVANKKKPGSEIGKEVLLHLSPPIDGAWHFCGFDCLAEWVQDQDQ